MLVAPKQELEGKSEWFYGVKSFLLEFFSILKKTVFEQNLAFAIVIFLCTCGSLSSLFSDF